MVGPVLYHIALYCMIWCCFISNDIVWYGFVLYRIVLYCMLWSDIESDRVVLHCIMWRCMVLSNVVLYGGYCLMSYNML